MRILARHSGFMLAMAVLIAAAIVVTGCRPSEPTATAPPPTPTSPAIDNEACETTLCCPDCEIIDVVGIQNGEQLTTEFGTLRMYGAYVDMQIESCARLAQERMTELVDGRVRAEDVRDKQTDSQGRSVAYLFTESGESIDEIMVREGLARAWTQDGQHVGWLVYLQARAAENDDGCIWSLGPLGR